MRRSIKNRPGVRARRVVLCLVAAVALLAFAPNIYAQPPRGLDRPPRGMERPIPSPRYYDGVRFIEAGDFTGAVQFYRGELKNAVRIGPELWIDSICYYAMIGEACYQAGDLNEALVNYNSAMTIAMAYPNWIGRVTFTTGVTQAPKGPAPWGPSRRRTPLGVFPDKATIIIGDKITEERLKQGGLITEQKAIPIDPIEILRCTALCIRRRTEILGPLAPFDPVSQQILETFRTRAVPPNHWAISWLDVIWGLALNQCDKTTSAVSSLSSALVMAGAYDHTLTGQALFELGNIFLKENKIREAAECYYEASIAAFHYGDNLLVEEAIRNYSNASKALGRGRNDPVVNLAYRWAKTLPGAQLLTSSFGLELVEEFIYQGKYNLATSGLAALDKTMRATAGRGLRQSRAADRWNYLNALLFYANGEILDGDEALAKVVEGAKVRSPWALQLMRLDNYVKKGLSSTGALTPRNAADLYEYLLREPTVVDWAVRPTDALSIQMIAPPTAYERWFCILIDRDLKDKAFEVAERVRRERFFRTQTFGGRLLSLRYILMADEELTTPSIRNARQTLLFEFPELEELTNDSKAIMDGLNSLPTVPTDSGIKDREVSLFERLAVVSGKQEAIMRFIAAGRVRIPYVFPPVYKVEEVQKRMPPDTAILSFIDAEGQTYGFMIGKDNLDAWRIGGTRQVAGAVSTFLRTIGLTEGTRQVAAADLAEAHWKSQGARLREIVLGAQDVDADRFNIIFSKLVVVPDGALWYLPFEALCLPAVASEVEEVDAGEEETPTDAKTGVLKAADAVNGAETQEAGAETDADKEQAEEEESDLDSVYRATEEEEEQLEQEEEVKETFTKELNESQDSKEETEDNSKEVKTENEAAPEPKKRKPRSAREREELERYEATLIPMIQASELTIRYSATVSLALPNALGRNAFVETTVAAGVSYPREPAERMEAAVDRFATAIPKTEAFRIGSLPIPGSIYAARLKRLVVFNEIQGDIWNWEPVTPGKTRGGSRVSDWIAAPWGAPRLFVAPSLRTYAENALKNGGDGSELFLPILAMQASGADGMLLSRWRTGGRSAYDLATDFVKNYESEPTADAWKRSALKLMQRDVVVEEEPRLRKLGRSEQTPKYDSPFWWAGYMVVDSGEAVKLEELDQLDKENVQKAKEEQALLKDGKAEALENQPDDGTENTDPNAGQTDENGEETEDGVVVPRFVNKNGDVGKTDGKDEDEADSFELDPKAIDDEDIEKMDEEGDDFFASDEDEEEAKPAPKEEPKAEDEESEPDPEEDEGLSTEDEPKAEGDSKEEPKADDAKGDSKEEPKADDAKGDSKEEPKASSPKKSDGKATSAKSGKVTLKSKK